MKCPSCQLTVSNKKDNCPRCSFDLSERKKELGITPSANRDNESETQADVQVASGSESGTQQAIEESSSVTPPAAALFEMHAEEAPTAVNKEAPEEDFLASVQNSLTEAQEAAQSLQGLPGENHSESRTPSHAVSLEELLSREDEELEIIPQKKEQFEMADDDDVEISVELEIEPEEELAVSDVAVDDDPLLAQLMNEFSSIESETTQQEITPQAETTVSAEAPQTSTSPADQLLSQLQQALAGSKGNDIKDKLEQMLAQLTESDPSDIQSHGDLIAALSSELDSELDMLLSEGTSFLGDGSENEQNEAEELSFEQEIAREIEQQAGIAQPIAGDNLDSLSSELEEELLQLTSEGATFSHSEEQAPVEFEQESPSVENEKQQPLQDANLTGSFLAEDLMQAAVEEVESTDSFIDNAFSSANKTPKAKPLPDADHTGSFLVSDLMSNIEPSVEDGVSDDLAALVDECSKSVQNPPSSAAKRKAVEPKKIKVEPVIEATSNLGPSAPWGKRALAFGIDALSAFVVGLLFATFTFLPEHLSSALFSFSMPDAIDLMPYVVEIYLSCLVVWVGLSVVLTAGTGQSVGEQAAQIRVRDTNGNPLSFSQAFWRALGQIASIWMLGLGYMKMFGKQKATFHDWCSDTFVEEQQR